VAAAVKASALLALSCGGERHQDRQLHRPATVLVSLVCQAPHCDGARCSRTWVVDSTVGVRPRLAWRCG
jgi:hypothetical protein